MPNPTLAALADDLEAAAPPPASWSRNASRGSPIPRARASAPSSMSTGMPRSEAADAMDRLRKARCRAVALCRHSRLGQGPLRHQGPGDPRRLARAGRFRAGRGRCARGGAVAPCRLHRDRPHQHDRVRLFRHRHQSALRHAEKRLAAQCRPRARRLVLGRGGVDCRPHGLRRARHRHRRLLPDSRGLQRHRRLQADAAARAARRRRAALVHARQFWAACQFGTVLRHARRGARGRAAADRSRRGRSRACGWPCR